MSGIKKPLINSRKDLMLAVVHAKQALNNEIVEVLVRHDCGANAVVNASPVNYFITRCTKLIFEQTCVVGVIVSVHVHIAVLSLIKAYR